MRKTKQPQGREEGIYFNLSKEAYHSDPALSHSGMTDVLVSWPDYWVNSPLNPNRKEFKQTDAMIFGDRCHQYLLEGNQFFKRYNVRGMNYDPKKMVISSSEFKKIKESVEAITGIPGMKEHFSVGYPEVAIFVRDPETGIMLRVMLDYLYVFGGLDYKRVKAMDNFTIGKAVRDQGLDIQHALYKFAIQQVRRRLKQGKAQAFDCPDPAFLEAFINDKDTMFRFLFQRSTPPYIWEFIELEPEVAQYGSDAFRIAIERYIQGLNQYGIGCPPLGKLPRHQSDIRTISSYHVPRRQYD